MVLVSANAVLLIPVFPMTRQLDLFQDWRPAKRSQSLTLEMDRAALERWKTRVYTYQQSIRHSQPPQQQTLFSLPSYGNPDEIDPFACDRTIRCFIACGKPLSQWTARPRDIYILLSMMLLL
ncbi:MAG: hypothetical protein HC890_18225 [Chloroflexaceae bacterium]|nr:hypothetical protein [Chloroflexaceae bacterium]